MKTNEIFHILGELQSANGYIDESGEAHRFTSEDRDLFIEIEKICASSYNIFCMMKERVES